MIKTVLKETPKVSIAEDFNQKRVRDYLTRHYIAHKQGVDMVNLALDKLDFIISQRGAEIVTVELLKVLIKRAIALADLQDDSQVIHTAEEMLSSGNISLSKYTSIKKDEALYTPEEIAIGHAYTRGQSVPRENKPICDAADCEEHGVFRGKYNYFLCIEHYKIAKKGYIHAN